MGNTPRSIGKYRVIEEISSGSYGRVYRGADTSRHNSPVAIKLMHAAHLASLQERSSFLQEAQLLTMLRHPYIVQVLDVGIEEEIPYLVMEYAPNGSLYDRLKTLAPRPLPVMDALTMLGQVGAALQYAHQQNVIHRDLKPANILFNAQGDALLADFGIATMLANSMKSGTVVGTPYYMAPEQFRGTISKEGDQYALGCIAYQALTGRLPFEAPDFFALGFKHMSESSIPPTQLNLLIPNPVEAAIMKAIGKDRTQRFPDVQSFVAALGATLPSPAPGLILPVTPLPPTTGEIPAVAQSPRPDGDDHTFVPRRYIEEGKATPPARPPVRVVHEEESQAVLPARNSVSGEWLTPSAAAREVEGQPLAFSNSPSYLVNAPAQAEMSSDVLPHESPGAKTPYPGAMAWSGYGSGEEDIPTVLQARGAARVGFEEEATLLAGLATGTGKQTASQNFAGRAGQTIIGSGGSIPPGARTWPDSSPVPQKKRRRGSSVLIAAIIALVVVLIGSGVLYAMTGIFRHSFNTQGQQLNALALPPGTAQASITPKRTLLDKTYTIYAVGGTPQASQQQVYIRSLSSASSSQSATDSSTGRGTIPGKEATGYLLVTNYEYVAVTVNVYFDFGSGNHVNFSIGAFTIAARTYNTYSAYASPAGTWGNIGAYSVNNGQLYCNKDGRGNCVSAKNTSAFSGGVNASSYSYVTQSDVNTVTNKAASQYESQEEASARSGILGQISSNEQMFGGISCAQHRSSNPSVNTRVSSVTASVWVSCSAEVYDNGGAQTLARSLLQKSITSTPGEKPVGNISTNVTSVSAGPNGTIAVVVEAKGAEVYSFNETQLGSWAALIAGKSVQEAQAILDGQTGVSKAVVVVSGGEGNTLPKNAKDIKIVVVSG